MQEFVRSIAGAALQTAQLLGKPVAILANTTLNQKFGIQENTTIAETDWLSMKYVTIGNGGARVGVGANGVPMMRAVQHSPEHAALYNHLPFVLRLPSDDLDAGQRSKYRLRRTEVHDGTTYVAYYLKVLDLTSTVPQLELRSVQNGVTISTPYVPSLSDLNPTPPAIDNQGVLVTTGNYIAATAKVSFTLNSWEIAEFLNVCNVIYGDEGYAIISEVGVCSGVDRAVIGDFNGSTSGYTEAIGVQICSFMSTTIPIWAINTSWEMLLDLGSVENLLQLTPAIP